MTAAGTFPSDATDQLIQANVVAAKYGDPRLSLSPALATATLVLLAFGAAKMRLVALTLGFGDRTEKYLRTPQMRKPVGHCISTIASRLSDRAWLKL